MNTLEAVGKEHPGCVLGEDPPSLWAFFDAILKGRANDLSLPLRTGDTDQEQMDVGLEAGPKGNSACLQSLALPGCAFPSVLYQFSSANSRMSCASQGRSEHIHRRDWVGCLGVPVLALGTSERERLPTLFL